METEGLVVLDKPQGITSRDAVDRAQRWFPRRTKLGHTGTLDPLATGVLVLCVGAATRLAEYVQRMSKAYDSTFVLGATSDSDDADGVVTPRGGAADPGIDAVRAGLARLVGALDQVPPAFSAAHVGGRRAYDLARRGEEVRLEPRRVTVYGIEVRRYEYPELEVSVECGKGTYIRSLARDLGEALGVGAYVASLRRTRVGPFTPDQASRDGDVRVVPAGLALAELPRVEVDEAAVTRLRQGQAVPVAAADAAEVAVFAAGRAVAVGAVSGGALRPGKVLG
ncbi:MAG: tRNA pseudouridine(55) synthase TruB [Gemmataceae bacterium]